jgi:hypothetical protein
MQNECFCANYYAEYCTNGIFTVYLHANYIFMQYLYSKLYFYKNN